MGICVSSPATSVVNTESSVAGSVGKTDNNNSINPQLPPFPPIWYRFMAEGENVDPRTIPLCTLCEMGKLQNSLHYMIECPTLDKFRKDLNSHAGKRWPDWQTLSKQEKHERIVADSDNTIIMCLKQFYTKTSGSSNLLSPAQKIHVSQRLLNLCEKLREPLH